MKTHAEVEQYLMLAKKEQRELLAALRGKHQFCYEGRRNEPLAHQCREQRNLYLRLARHAH